MKEDDINCLIGTIEASFKFVSVFDVATKKRLENTEVLFFNLIPG
jgi:hypothetical protein